MKDVKSSGKDEAVTIRIIPRKVVDKPSKDDKDSIESTEALEPTKISMTETVRRSKDFKRGSEGTFSCD